jgi:hypothetical protein
MLNSAAMQSQPCMHPVNASSCRCRASQLSAFVQSCFSEQAAQALVEAFYMVIIVVELTWTSLSAILINKMQRSLSNTDIAVQSLKVEIGITRIVIHPPGGVRV